MTGFVQGVFFRASMAEAARGAGVAGSVRNLPDGSVEAHLEGDGASVQNVIAWARKGPPGARVDSVEMEAAPVENLKEFKIMR